MSDASNVPAESQKNQRATPARALAVQLLIAVCAEGRMLSEALGRSFAKEAAPQDRARAQRLATETLRWAPRADRFLGKHMTRRPQPEVQALLRLGVVEVAHLGAPAGPVVDDLVRAAGADGRTKQAKGMVNAVLRKACEDASANWGKAPVPSMRTWLRGPLLEAWGNGAMTKIERAHAIGAPLDITPKGDAAACAKILGGTVLPTGSVRLDKQGQVSALPGYDEGDWWVQDAAAALPVQVAAPQSGERVLDLCAAPGGKTMQLAAAGTHVTAVDLSQVRLDLVAQNLERTKLKADLRCADVFDVVGQWDLVLLDAPCSATGTIRRHPDLTFARTGEGISELIDLQARMLDHAAQLVRPEGRMVYCTCSLIPDEGEAQIDEFIERNPDWCSVRPELDWIEGAWRSSEGGLRLRPDFWPDRGGMDGFYIALLQRTA